MYAIFLNKILLPIGSILFSGNYSDYLRQWERYDAMDASSLDKIQKAKLTEILAYSQKNVPYFRNLNLRPNAPLKDFPVLTKSILRAETDALISDQYKKKKLDKNYSSGSSGEQSFTYMTHEHKFFLRALQTHWWKWGGYNPGDFLIQTGISPKRTLPKKLKDFFFRTLYLEAFTLRTNSIKKALHRSEHKTPKHLAGYPSALNEIALIAIDENKCYEFKSLISYGDKLFQHFEKNYKLAFQNPTIVNTYGCAEGLYMACKIDLPYYYIMSPHVYLEIVDDTNNPLKDGERGHILVTCLTNKAMPIIRYKLGDLGILLPRSEYPKNMRFNYPILKEITGRETDVIRAPNGDTLLLHSFTGIMEYFIEIKQFKVIQTSKDTLLIEYITDTNKKIPKSTEIIILKKFGELLSNSMEVSFQLVNEIVASPSGKPQIIEIRNTD